MASWVSLLSEPWLVLVQWILTVQTDFLPTSPACPLSATMLLHLLCWLCPFQPLQDLSR